MFKIIIIKEFNDDDVVDDGFMSFHYITFYVNFVVAIITKWRKYLAEIISKENKNKN